LPRVVPRGGASICGKYIPEGSIVAVWQWALYHNENLFKDPLGFHPERFLGDPEFEGHRREAFQPFLAVFYYAA
jgi:cytochrome P450